jgi:hypothetical protein
MSLWGISSAGRATDLHSVGQRFEPAILHSREDRQSLYRFFSCETYRCPSGSHWLLLGSDREPQAVPRPEVSGFHSAFRRFE